MAISEYRIEHPFASTLRFNFPVRSKWRAIIEFASFSIFFVVLVFIIARNWDFIGFLVSDPLPLVVLFLFSLQLMISGVSTAWFLWGKESLEVSNSAVVIRHQIGGITALRVLESTQVNAIYISRFQSKLSHNYCYRTLPFYCFKNGTIAINSGKNWLGGVRTFRCGISVENEEAQKVITLIHAHFPRYRYPQNQSS